MTFIDNPYPQTTAGGQVQTEAGWKVEKILVKRAASINSGATILSEVSIDKNAIVGDESVVTKDVPLNTIA